MRGEKAKKIWDFLKNSLRLIGMLKEKKQEATRKYFVKILITYEFKIAPKAREVI